MNRKPSKNRIVIVGVNRDAGDRIFRRRDELKSQFSARWNAKDKVWWFDISRIDDLKAYLHENGIHAELVSEYDYAGLLCAVEDGDTGVQLSDIAKDMGITFKQVKVLHDIITKNPSRR